MAETKEQWIARNCKSMGWSREEAEQVWNDDKAIDRGEKMPFDMSKEEEKKIKKYINAGTRKAPTVYKFGKPQRKANPTKAGLISELFNFLSNLDNIEIKNCEITNKERQIAFSIKENNFELTLTQKRQKKIIAGQNW